MKRSIIRFLIESGVQKNDPLSKRRGVIFSNYIALILCGANLLLFLIIPGNHNVGGFREAMLSIAIFYFPILLNRWSLVNISRLYLCWVPSILVTWIMISGMKEAHAVPVSSYYGLRIYLAATGSIPFLLMDRKNPWLFIIGIIPTLTILVFYDYLLDLAGANAEHLWFSLTSVRSLVAYGVIGSSCFAMRYIVDRTDTLNQKLISELEQKNEIIRQQAASELNKLNQQLQVKVDELSEREFVLKDSQYTLNERVKELTTLYKTSLLLQTEKKPIHEVLQGIVNLLPPGWQYPSITQARISLAGMEFLSDNFTEYKHRQLTEFTTTNGLQGTIEVVYLENCPPSDEGPFLKEERNLISIIADMLRIYLNQRFEADALRRSEANQSATINNTNFLIWSVNREYEVISFNKKFAEYFKKHYNITVRVGHRLADDAVVSQDRKAQWVIHYNRALAGETFKVNVHIDDRNIEYSLNPIIEEGKIIGASIFGEDITERVRQQKELMIANKQLGELRLMALRSAMNPHFIFNCLNSIQYYIMEKDQKSAVTYLSTFSKLIRSILNNSVKNRVRLTDEIDMINHYIQLEAIRFENKFTYEISVDPEVDIESIEIPSMLVQPYVENAILHGLNNKEAKGMLKISISTHQDKVLFEIEDNGIGREAAAMSKQLNLTQHKSMGTALTEERLKLINDDDSTSVEIIDLKTNGIASGTKVNVWIKE